ncbi:MAG TPA: hypothetical protein ENH82_07430 [bacterium]|nr:hypothetical protein [bacterium]
MKVTLVTEENNIIDLDIVFHRTRLGERAYAGKKELIDTHCEVFRDEQLITSTVAYQNSKDEYNKITGRKVALAKAICLMAFLSWVPYTSPINDQRLVMRKRIWAAFKETFMKHLVKV